MAVLTPHDNIYSQYQKVVASKQIVKYSFIHTYLGGGGSKSSMEVITPKPYALHSKEWTTLPKKAWIYLQNSTNKSTFFMQIWIEHLKKVTK